MGSVYTRSAKHSVFGAAAELPKQQIPTYEDVFKAYYWRLKQLILLSCNAKELFEGRMLMLSIMIRDRKYCIGFDGRQNVMLVNTSRC